MITEKRIANYTKGFKEIQQYILSNKGYISTNKQKEIFSKYQMSKCAMTRATELNYFKKIAPCEFKCILFTFEPINARKVIERTNIKVMEAYNKKLNIKVTKENNSILIENKSRVPYVKPKKNIKSTLLTKPVKEKRRISILWGLITWSRN